MEKMLVVTSTATTVKANTEKNGCRYEVEYEYREKTLQSVKCNIYKADGNSFVGYMALQNGSKNISVQDGNETTAHATVFEEIIAEIKSEVESEVSDE